MLLWPVWRFCFFAKHVHVLVERFTETILSLPFVIQRQSSPMARRDKDSHLLLCRRLDVFRSRLFLVSLCQPKTSESISTRRQIMVICHLCYPETIKSDSTRRQIMVSHHLSHPETFTSDGMRRPSWSSVFIVLKAIEASLVIQRQASPMVCRDNDGHPFLFVFKIFVVPFAIQRQSSPMACEN